MICSQRPFKVSGMTRMILHGFHRMDQKLFTNSDDLAVICPRLSIMLTELPSYDHRTKPVGSGFWILI